MAISIKIQNLSKQYRLGLVSSRTLSHDINRWWQIQIRGKEDPYLKIGESNIRDQRGDSEYVWALRDINLEVEEGEVLGIIGKNGAGKSTLLKILSKVTAPTTGIIKARGRIASLLEVGTGFHQEMTGRENIYLNGAILGMTKDEIKRKLDEIIDFAGIERYIDTPVKRFSSGMMVRLGFAVAAHLEPEILVVDEVLAVGDLEFQKKATGKIKDVNTQKGRTVLFVSHNMSSVQAICKRGLILQNGEIFKVGDVNDIINTYLAENSLSRKKHYKRLEISKEQIAWIEEAYVSTNNKEASILLCGQDIEFIIKYRSNKTNQKADIFMGIYDAYNEKLFHLGTKYSNIETFKTKEKGTIACKIPKTPLIRGNYSVNIALIINGETHDHVQNAFTFKIENGDFYGNGKLPDLYGNKFLVEQFWRIY